MTDEEVRRIVSDAVEDTLMHFGIEVEEPRKMQADLVFLRRQRLAQEAMGMRVKIGFVVTLVGMAWLRSHGRSRTRSAWDRNDDWAQQRMGEPCQDQKSTATLK